MNFLSFFDHRPSGVESVRTGRCHYPPPDDWWFSGWHSWKGGEDDDFLPADPLSISTTERRRFLEKGGEIIGRFEVSGYINSMHRTAPQEGDGGARLHILFSESPVRHKPRFFADFRETKEGGLLVTHNSGCYSRQIHIVERTPLGDEEEVDQIERENRMLPHILEPSMKAGSRIRLSGLVIWMEFVDESIVADCAFQGFDDRTQCPVVEIHKWEHLPSPMPRSLQRMSEESVIRGCQSIIDYA